MLDAIVRVKVATVLLGISRSAIYSKMDETSRYYDSTFPELVRLGPRTVGFRKSELEAWLNQLNKAA